MKTSSNLAPTILKSIVLATILFWFFIFSKEFDADMVMFLFLSIIPISIFVFFTIIITIMPFIWFKKENINKDKIFKKYFPYYSIIAFSISAYNIIDSNFNIFDCGFFITVFITLVQSWVWLCKPDNNKKLVSS